MLEGKELILATRKYASEERALSWKVTLSTLFLLLLSYMLSYSVPVLIMQLVFATIAGLLVVRMFIIYHDYVHHAILQKSVIAKFIFTLFGWYFLAPISIWKRSHDYHHKHNSKLYTAYIGSYPIATKEHFLKSSKFEQLAYLFIRHPFTILMGYIFTFAYGMSVRSLVRSPMKHWDSLIALIFHYGIGYLIYHFGGVSAFLITFLLPSLIASGIGSYLFYAQHNFPDATFEDKEGWTYIGAALNSSSYMKMSKLMHWFTGNIGYHHIHHANARIPFYKLPQVYTEMEEFQNCKTTSLRLKDILACFRIKIWDPALNRMITQNEL